MEKLLITGGTPLKGEVTIGGAKNAIVAIIPATLLVEGKCIIENVPNINDVSVIMGILAQLGAETKWLDETTIEIDCSSVNSCRATFELVNKMRASYYLMGALLGRFKHAIVSYPGGCNFGSRPVDQHLKGFRAMGVEVRECNSYLDPATNKLMDGYYDLETDQLMGGQIFFDVVSVGATINVMLAAVRADGITIIENAAKEPHIVDLANFLNSMGANIKGAGTDVIKIKGVSQLLGGTYYAIPDYVEAGTYMLMAAATKGEVMINNVIPKHLESVTSKIRDVGGQVVEYDDAIFVKGPKRVHSARVKTLPYPGFPTDLQPLAGTLLAVGQGTSFLTEAVWDNRFQYVEELNRFGSKITVSGNTAVIEGVESLHSARAKCTDLRGGAAMVMAALMAKGTSEIHNLIHVDRGYENFEEKLRLLGADIRRVTDQD
ncbi:MAG: UDP-N-acetylglucosamine 1-carboxyvinyltransferase [Clostridia bacterium]|nr:UDP-N-acetylglucosamine 1-carboxyvinyltransferase [Clostridia bacterium]